MFISKDDKEKIELLNKTLGTKHRTRPYDLSNPKDMIEAATYITAEYIDLYRYWTNIANVNSDLDESIEVFHPAKWMSITLDSTTHDERLDYVCSLLNQLEDGFSELVNEMEQKCSGIWKVILLNDFKEVKEHFLGEAISYDKDQANLILDEYIFEISERINYDGNIENSAKEFARGLHKMLTE